MTSTETRDKIKILLSQATNPKQKKLYQDMLEKIEPKKPVIVKKKGDSQENKTPILKDNNKYHAVGVIITEVDFIEERKAIIKLDGKEYSLIPTINHRPTVRYLKKNIEITGTKRQKLIVYPRIIHLPNRNEPHQLSFTLLGFEGAEENKEGTIIAEGGQPHALHRSAFLGRGNLARVAPPFQGRERLTDWLGDREFRLSGIWQFISCCKCPVITARRNFSQEKLREYKEMGDNIKRVYARACHAPVFWKDPKVLPFRHNRHKSKEEQMPLYFIDAKVVFLPKQNAFGFRELLGEPTTDHPKYISPPKKQKK